MADDASSIPWPSWKMIERIDASNGEGSASTVCRVWYSALISAKLLRDPRCLLRRKERE
jgi:hypothetical protein